MTLLEAAAAVVAAWDAQGSSAEPDLLTPAIAELETIVDTLSAPMPPVELTVDLPAPVGTATAKYTAIALHPPTLDEMLKASATPGSSQADVTKKLISLVTGMPPDLVGQLPAWFITKIDQYFDAFNRAPPLHPTIGA